jgi:hypothetical protein
MYSCCRSQPQHNVVRADHVLVRLRAYIAHAVTQQAVHYFDVASTEDELVLNYVVSMLREGEVQGDRNKALATGALVSKGNGKG